METLSMEFLRTEFASIFSGSNENLYSPEEQPSQLSSSSSEQSFHLRDSLNSNSSLRLDIRDSRMSSSSSEFATSPTQKDLPRAESPSHRGSQTLPHHRKPSTPTRYLFICMLCLLSGCGKSACSLTRMLFNILYLHVLFSTLAFFWKFLLQPFCFHFTATLLPKLVSCDCIWYHLFSVHSHLWMPCKHSLN